MRRAGISTERVHTGNPDVDAIWRRLTELATLLNASPFVGGRLITEEDGPDVQPGSGLSFTLGTARSIPHKLGRKARGFVEMYGADVPSASMCRLRPTAHPSGKSSEKYITATSSATGVCWLWVF